MKSRTLHISWAAATLVAFVAGSLRPTGTPSDNTGSPQDDSATLSGIGTSGLEAGESLVSRLRRDGETSSRSPIQELFGSFSADGVSLSTLADQAFRDPNPITRRLAFGQLLSALTRENAVEIREMLVANGANGDEWRDFHYSWGALAGREAFDQALASDEQDLAATMSGWAAANPSEAIDLLDNLPENMADSRAQIAESVVAGLADRDLAAATALAVRLAKEGAGRPDRLIRSVANEALRQGGPREAASWAETLEAGPVKGAAMDRIAGAYVREDPQAAAVWVERFADEDYAARAVAEVGEEWGERDPISAVNWLETLPSGRGQADGFRSVLGDWEDSDPVAASQYLAQMPPSPERDAAVSGFARGYAWQDPQAAIAWAQDISDPDLRQQSLTRAGQAYYRRDPESARAWLESIDLPDEVRQRITNPWRRR